MICTVNDGRYHGLREGEVSRFMFVMNRPQISQILAD